jgi:predicted ATP-grasp superfamily ATP-dependent carboligase
MSAIVLDGHLKSALATVRSLGAKGIHVACGAERSTALALHSRFAVETFVYPSPKKDADGFLVAVEEQAKAAFEKTGERPVLFAFSDATFLLLARSYEKMRAYAVMPMPSLSTTEIASDKRATYDLAQALSIPTIQTYTKEAFGTITYPAVVKNRHSIVWKHGTAVSGSAVFVQSKEELQTAVEHITRATGEEPLVMEFITGEEYGVEMVCKDGEVVSEFAHKRIRSLSPRGGAAVVKETAQDTEEVRMMKQYAHALVSKLQWTGPVMVEFKIDSRNGSVVLMEINGRFWGSLPLAIKAGVDFPMHVHDVTQAVQNPIVSVSRFVRTRHFLGDCKWLYLVLFSRDPLRNTVYPSRLKALWDFKTEIFRSTGDVFLWSDPLPSFFEYIDILYTWKSKA